MHRMRYLHLCLILALVVSWLVPAAVPASAATPTEEELSAATGVTAASAVSWCIAGPFNGWNNNLDHLFDDGTQGDLVAGDGIYTLDYVVSAAGRDEWKAVECNNWGNAHPAANAWFNTSSANQMVKFTLDTNDHSADAGWALKPATNIVATADTLPTSYTAVGDFQGWNNADSATHLAYAGNGIYYLQYTIPAAGTYIGKVTTTGSWDGFGLDGRSVDPGNLSFTTTSANQTVVFILNAYSGRVMITPQGTAGSGSWCVAGGFNGWSNGANPLTDNGSQGDLLAGDGIYSLDYPVVTAGRTEWKVFTCGTWSGYPNSNSWLNTSAANQQVKFTFDTNNHSSDAGWALLPATNIVHATDDLPASLTAVGSFQGWNNANPATVLTTTLGTYYLRYPIATAEAHTGKVTTTGNWDAIGADGRSVGAVDISFTVQDNNDVVPFIYDSTTGRVGIFPPVTFLLDVTTPVEGAQSAVPGIDVTGTVFPAAGASVTVNLNGTSTFTQTFGLDGSFTQPLTLVRGANTVTVTATDGVTTRTVIRHVTYGAAHDNNIWWGELGHDSRDTRFRTPGGPVATGTPVILRLRAASNDLTAARVRVYNDRTNTQFFLDMTLAAEDGVYEWWEATVPASALPTIYWYRFIVSDGTDTAYYEDDAQRTGGWGTTFPSSLDNSWQLTVYDPAFQTPDWVKNAVVYQIFPDRFRDGNAANDPVAGEFFYDEPGGTVVRSLDIEGDWNTPICDPRGTDACAGTYSKNFYGGDLQGLVAKLDYLQSLGVNTIYLNPIFESPSNHKYDTTDYWHVDDAFGGDTAFITLTEQLAARNMNLILDGVFNHTSSDSIYFDLYGRYDTLGACESPASPYRDWYYFIPPTPGNPGVCVGNDGTPNALAYESWFGYTSLPKLRSDATGVRNMIWMSSTDSVGPHWIIQGAQGWRLDVGGDVDPGTTNDPANNYWEGFRQALMDAAPGPYSETNPQPYIVGEEWGNATSWTIGSEWDATMNYQYSTAMLGFWRDETFVDNDHNSGSSSGEIVPLTPSELDARLHNWQERYAPEAYYAMMNLLGSHDTSRALFMLDHNADLNNPSLYQNPAYDWSDAINRLKGVVILQMTLPGAPTIYYGDEIGLVGPMAYAGGKWEDDPYNRQPYPWLDQSGTPFYTHLQSQNLAARQDLYDYYALLTGTRSDHPALRTGSFDTLLVDDPNKVYAYGRKLADNSDAGIVILNRNSTAQEVVMDLSGYLLGGLELVDVLDSNQAYTLDSSGILTVTVASNFGAVLVTGAPFAAPPAAVTDLVVSAEGDTTLTLSWTPVSGATGYEVYRSLLNGGGYEYIGQTANSPVTDDGLVNGTEYFYVIYAVDSATGLKSPISNQASGIPHPAIGWANLQWPWDITHTIGITPTGNIYGQVWVSGYTEPPGPMPGMLAQVGFGPVGTAPATWENWFDTVFNNNAGNNDEYQGQLLPETTGSFEYVYRYSTTGGRDWVYADRSGIIDGTLAAITPGLLTVNPAADTTPPDAPLNLHVVSQSASFVVLGWDAVTAPDLYAYDLYRSEISSTLGTKVARILAPSIVYTDTNVTSGITYYYVVRALDDHFNFSTNSNQVAATPQPRLVALTLHVTVPTYTPADANVYFTRSVNPDGTLGGWSPSATLLNRVDQTHYTATLSILEGTQIEFKFARGTWETVEKGTAYEEINNRQILVLYGTDGTQHEYLTVAHWRDPLVAAHSPADGAVNVPITTTVVVSWSKPMLPDTSFAVASAAGPVSGTFNYTDTNHTVTFMPAQPLAYNTTYTVTVSGQIDQSLGAGDGPDLQQVPVTFSFTTLLPEVYLSSSTYTVGESSGSASIRVNLSGASGQPVDIHFTAVPGTAGLADFTPVSTTVTIPAGAISTTVSIPITADLLYEPDETILLAIDGPVEAVLGTPASATLTILDDETLPTVSLSSASYTVGESSSPAVITVTLSGASSQSVTFHFDATPGTAGLGDFTPVSTTVTILAGATNKTVSVPITQDALYEPDETVLLEISNPVGAGLGTPASATLTILDDDPMPTVALSSASYTVGESNGPAVITVTLSAPSGLPVTVHFDATPGTAEMGDFTPVATTVTIPAGTLTKTVAVPVTPDTLYELDETVLLEISNPSGAALGIPTSATLTVLDDDSQPAVALSAATYSVGESSGPAIITVTLSALSGVPVTVHFDATPGTAGLGDFTPVSTTLTIPAGTLSKTVVVPITADTLYEPDETVLLEISNPAGAVLGSPASATLTILDDDSQPAVALSAATYSVGESSGPAVITVTLSALSGVPVTVHYAAAPGTAGLADFTPVSTTVTIPAGTLSKTVVVPITADTLYEPDETVLLSISSPTEAVLGSPVSATLTILDDEPLPTVALSAANYTVSESGGSAVITLTLSGASSQAASVHFAATPGTAGLSDFTSISTTVTFAAGVTSQVVSISITPDAWKEPGETILLQLSSPVGSALGTPATATLLILDDDYQLFLPLIMRN